MANMHPDELFSMIHENASTRKKKTLLTIHNACRKQSESIAKDFSLSAIARLIADEGGPTEQALRNKNAEDYRALISRWAEYCNTNTKKPRKEKSSTMHDEILSNISDPTVKALVGIIMAENRKLKRENSLLKEQTLFTIDMRPESNKQDNNDSFLVVPSYNLTDTEIDALRHAISDEFMNYRGWTVDEYGRVKEKDFQVYKAGYVSAIKKVLKVDS